MIRTARPPAGPVLGLALVGRYPSPSIGLPVAGGFAEWDDFLGEYDKVAPLRSTLPWAVTDIGATGIAVAAATPSAATERGVLHATAGTILQGGTVNLPAVLVGGVPIGLMWGAKLSTPSAALTDQLLWSGLASSRSTGPLVATAMSFVGVRHLSSEGGNWYGVVKDGSTAANETVVDLGDTADSTYRAYGLIRTSTGVQFGSIASTATRVPYFTAVGAEVVTNLPTADLYPIAVGLYTTAAAVKEAKVDWWGTGGSVLR